MVNVSLLEDEPFVLAATGAKISQTPFKKTIQELYEESRANKDESKKLVNAIMNKHGHMVLGDFSSYAIAIEDMSRLAAIYLWRNVSGDNLIYGAGIEASLRVIKPERCHEVVGDFGKLTFETYQKAINSMVPEQDARYVLPEGTLTRMIFTAPPRHLVKIANSLKAAQLLELKEIGEKIENLVEKRFALDIPQENPVSEWNFWGQKTIEDKTHLVYSDNIYSISLDMGIEGSLAMYAQMVRQRQMLCIIEPLEQIARRGTFIVPPTFCEEIMKDYKELAKQARSKQIELIERKDPNFAYFLLMGQQAKGRIYGKGAGIIEMSRARSEGVAQWEIRNKVGIPLTKELAKIDELKREIGPRCWREKRCIEPLTFKTKKNVCKVFSKTRGNWQESLEELLQTLSEKWETFSV
jgi:hypothetical protein